jgi:hypothetical protein
MLDEARKQRAVEAIKKYKSTLTRFSSSISSIRVDLNNSVEHCRHAWTSLALEPPLRCAGCKTASWQRPPKWRLKKKERMALQAEAAANRESVSVTEQPELAVQAVPVSPALVEQYASRLPVADQDPVRKIRR